MARLELTTPRTQNECATNCATSRRLKFFNEKVWLYFIDFIVLKQVLRYKLLSQFTQDARLGVPTLHVGCKILG